MAARRNTSISIAKGIAIILMCMGHTECRQWIMTFIYSFHMPLFFITAGYFFNKKYLSQPWTFVVKRFRGLYVPFVKWAVFFLVIHNLMFGVGVLNEQYGNWEGGVTHPYTFQQALQNLVSIVFSMGGYDVFLAGAFWFFRALLVSSIVFLVLYLLIGGRRRWLTDDVSLALIAALTLAFTYLKIHYHLSITTVVQHGIRECWGVLFFTLGVLYRRHEGLFRKNVWTTLLCLAVLVGGIALHVHGMVLKPADRDVLTLPVTGMAGFWMTHNIATWIDRHPGAVRRFLVYCGDNTLYVLVFHISAFKLVSLLKIWYYGLDWRQVGCHMVVHEHSHDDLFFLLYTAVGTAVPLLGIWLWRKLKAARAKTATTQEQSIN